MSPVKFIIYLSFFAMLGLAGCSSNAAPGKTLQSKIQRDLLPQVSPADAQELSAGNTAFALDLYQAVRDEPGNLFFSPYSLSTALAMTYAGAKGETAAQMAKVLHYTLPPEALDPAFNALDLALQPEKGDNGTFQLSIANALWGQQGLFFIPEYIDLLAQNYGAGLRLMDFATRPEPSRQEINQWVEDQTNQRIKDLIPQGSVTPATRLVLTNAIYFKADWLTQFEPNNTRDAPFNRLDDSQVSVPLMAYKRPPQLPYFAGDGFQAIELPYVGERTSMLIIVPEQGKFAAVEAGLDSARLEAIIAGLQPERIILNLPKFQFEDSYLLKDTLSGMGMPAAFDPDQADFSGMVQDEPLFISQVLHKAFVAVDEKGTEAAAATAVIMDTTALMPGVTLIVDRPFIFLIRDQSTNSILFLGRLLDPNL